MIIFGTRGVTTTKERGRFHCPSCGGPQTYDAKRVRRFFTLYFIPVIPLDVLGEYVECMTCRKQFKTEVLSMDFGAGGAGAAGEQQAFAEMMLAVQLVMFHMMGADGRVEHTEVDTARALYAQLCGVQMTDAEVQRGIQEAKAGFPALLSLLGELGPRLSEQGKELVVQAGLGIATADGDASEEEMKMLLQIAGTVKMSAAHLRGVLSGPGGKK